MALHPPQSVQLGGTPVNIFDTLTVTFQTAGVATLSTIADFGPPNQAHAYVFTSTDDTLLAGTSTIGREIVAPLGHTDDAEFNLRHTCASPAQPMTTTTTTTRTTAPTSFLSAPTVLRAYKCSHSCFGVGVGGNLRCGSC